ncbi:MAG: hypothetical protein JWQ71_1457 [Pedosphaera sp.]|nr:hypothetical protein [Pedosphaera sp.]
MRSKRLFKFYGILSSLFLASLLWLLWDGTVSRLDSSDGHHPSPVGTPDYTLKINRIQDVPGLTDSALVGERVTLICNLVVPDGSAAPAITNFSWSIQGYVVSDYIADNSTGRVEAVFSLKNAAVSYCWVNGGEKQVRCTADVNGTRLMARTSFNVIKPTAEIITRTGAVAVDEWPARLELHFGGETGPGIEFSNQRADTYGGVMQWVQTATALRKRQLNDSTWQRWAGSGLDTVYPYETRDPVSDYPGTPLRNDCLKKSIWDSHEMWLMFKPPGADSIFVPLRAVRWYWTGSATRGATGWTLDPRSVAHSVNPKDYETTSFPTWTNNVANSDWTNE